MTLIVENLCVARGDRVILRDISFRVAGGELLHVTGRNGTGKTTLLEAVAGLRFPLEGTVSGAEPGQLHWVGHRNGLHGALSPMENLRFWCALHGGDKAMVEPVLQRLGLKRQRHRPCRALSAGQRRRTALARLLLAQRPLWLLDEPLAALDSEGVPLFGELLVEHAATGGAAVVSTHQPLPANAPPARVVALQ